MSLRTEVGYLDLFEIFNKISTLKLATVLKHQVTHVVRTGR